MPLLSCIVHGEDIPSRDKNSPSQLGTCRHDKHGISLFWKRQVLGLGLSIDEISCLQFPVYDGFFFVFVCWSRVSDNLGCVSDDADPALMIRCLKNRARPYMWIRSDAVLFLRSERGRGFNSRSFRSCRISFTDFFNP